MTQIRPAGHVATHDPMGFGELLSAVAFVVSVLALMLISRGWFA